MNDNPNKTYYQRVYSKLHASEQLKERLINMNDPIHPSTRPSRKTAWKTAAAAILLAAALPTGAYAANHYWGITDFFKHAGNKLPKEAEHLIETDIAQTQNDPGSAANTPDGSGSIPSGKLPVSFTVQEALCDSGTLSVIVEAKAAESGKYLLVPDDCTTEEDSAESIGIHEDISIGAYAKEKGLEILYINSGFAPESPFSPGACHISAKSIQDDTLSIFIQADRASSDTCLNAVLSHTIRPGSGSSAEIMKTSSSFLLKDNSTSRKTVYRPKTSGHIQGTEANVQSVTIEQTEIFTYVDIYYRNPQAAAETDGLSFSITDSSNAAWNERSGRGIIQLADGTYFLRLCYDKTNLPKTCMLHAFDYLEKTTYGQIELVPVQN